MSESSATTPHGYHVLDPKFAPAAVAVFESTAMLPKDLRKLGAAPDFSSLLPSDVILYSSIADQKSSREITEAQSQFSEFHRKWTHAALYLGQNRIIEAIPFGGAKLSNIFAEVASHRMRVRRMPGLDESARFQIALEAATQLGAGYNWLGLVPLSRRLKNPRNWKVPSYSKSKYCSQLCENAYLFGSNKSLVGKYIGEDLSPAHISASTALEDIEVIWKRIA